MNLMHELSNDNLVALATGTYVNGDVLNAVNGEILRRLGKNESTNQENAIRSLQEVQAKFHYELKVMNDRYDQVCKNLVELSETAKERNK